MENVQGRNHIWLRKDDIVFLNINETGWKKHNTLENKTNLKMISFIQRDSETITEPPTNPFSQ